MLSRPARRFRPAASIARRRPPVKGEIGASASHSRAQRLGPARIVDDYGADGDVVQQAPTGIEQADQRDERRQEADADPLDDGMHGAE